MSKPMNPTDAFREAFNLPVNVEMIIPDEAAITARKNAMYQKLAKEIMKKDGE